MMTDRKASSAAQPRRVLVTGSRDFKPALRIVERIYELPQGSTIVHGGARGADRIAGEAAENIGLKVEVYPVTPSDWQRFGKRAGFLRNETMLDSRPDKVLAFWDGKSRGTAHTIREAEKRGIPVEVIRG